MQDRAHIPPFPYGGSLGGFWFELCVFPVPLGRCVVSLSALPFPYGGSLGGFWFELCAFPVPLGRCMLSLSALPFPYGGSLGGELCAIAPTENTDVNAAAKRNFFTIFSEVFRLYRIGPFMTRVTVPTTI